MYILLEYVFKRFTMLTETERKEIFDVVQSYRKAHLRLADNYKDKRAHTVVERCSRRAGHYLYIMKQSLYNGGQNLNDDDIKCFALLVDSFEQMQRNRLLSDLQKYASFDVVSFVGAYNRGIESKVRISKKKDITELSEKDLKRRVDKISRARKNIKKHRMTFHYMAICDVIRDEANELAHAVVNNKLRNYSKSYLESVRKLLDTVIVNSVDGDIVDLANKILVEKIKEMDIHTEIEDFVSVHQPEKELEHQLPADVEQLDAEQTERVISVAENDDVKQNTEAKHDEMLRREAEQAEQTRLKEIERQERKERRKARIDNTKQTISDAAGKVAGGFVSIKDKLKSKWQAKKSEIETAKRNREIIRDAERASKEHWNELKLKEKQAEEEKKNLGHFYRNLFAQPSVAPIAALVAVAGMWVMFLTTNNNSVPVKSDKKNIKTEQNKPVVQKAEPVVAIDTAYAEALVNYYNSALDIIGGAKKDDVLTKIQNQVKAGNIVLGDYISVERIAYAYFIYREYGFNIDVLNLAVNGSQKLTDAQMAELNKVIMDAGERGQGVQKQAKQKVEARGGHLSTGHSKFERASKQQQLQYLHYKGVVKKAHVR